MRKLITFIFVLVWVALLSSCKDFQAKRDYQKEHYELRIKTERLDYLKALHNAREYMDISDAKKIIDSMILEHEALIRKDIEEIEARE